MALTPKGIAKLRQRKRAGRYHDAHGLYLRVTSKTSASWILRYEFRGHERMLGLGPLRLVGLKEARQRAHAAQRRLKLDGIDPVLDRREKKAERALAAAKAMSFEDAAKAFHAQHEAKWKNAKHSAQFLSTLRAYVFPTFGRLPVGAIDTGLVLQALEPIWQTKTETASRVRGRIESVLDWASVRGYRSGDNPARWKGHLEEVLPARGQIAKVEHHPALPYAELPDFMRTLRQRPGSAARALEFCILTASRTGEVIGAKWAEIDLKAGTWTVPAGRMKGSREHRVPLSPRAIKLLQDLPREDGNEFVFLGSSAGISNMAMTAVLRRMDRGDITVHGFRSTFMDWAHEQTPFPKVVIDAALAHVVGDKVEAAYRRGDLFGKRAQLMKKWAMFCEPSR
jgi:integrase